MKLSNEQYLVFNGLFQLIIAAIYAFIGLSNYPFEWFNFEFAQYFKSLPILKLNNSDKYVPDLTWGLAGFNAIMFVIYWVLWRENEIKRKDSNLQDTPFGFYLFVLVLALYFSMGYGNDLTFAITSCYALLSLIVFPAS